MVTTDYGFLVALSRALSDDDTLFGMVDGKFEIDFPAKNVSENLTGGTQTMISVSQQYLTEHAMCLYRKHFFCQHFHTMEHVGFYYLQ